MSEIKQNAFYYPTIPANHSSAPPAEQTAKTIDKVTSAQNALIDFTTGKVADMDLVKELYKQQGGNKIRKYNKKRMPTKRSSSKRTSGLRRVHQRGRGRTINVPKELPEGVIPPSSFNGAITIGERCEGGWCAIPTPPVQSYLMSENLKSADPPAMAMNVYPSLPRLGNNPTEYSPNTEVYTGTALNYGPFAILSQKGGRRSSKGYEYITNPETNRKVKVKSRVGRAVLRKYLEKSH
jgi:hypothetical protein